MSEFRTRVLAPLAFPILSLLVVGIFAFAYSRVLLAVPKYWSVSLAGLLAAEILGIAAVLTAVRRITGTQRVLVGLLGAIVLIGGGVGWASGIRPIEAHHEPVTLVAEGSVFLQDTIEVPADEAFELAFENLDAGIPHNVAFYADDTASQSLFVGEIFNGVETRVYEVPAIPAGEHFYRCDIHPTTMTGTAIAGGEGGHGGEDGGEDGEGGDHGGDAAPDATVVSEGLVFDADTIAVPASQTVSIEFVNQDAGIPHNVSVYTDDTASESIFLGEIFNGVATEVYTFESPEPGEYFFRCDVHPTTMTGTFVTE